MILSSISHVYKYNLVVFTSLSGKWLKILVFVFGLGCLEGGLYNKCVQWQQHSSWDFSFFPWSYCHEIFKFIFSRYFLFFIKNRRLSVDWKRQIQVMRNAIANFSVLTFLWAVHKVRRVTYLSTQVLECIMGFILRVIFSLIARKGSPNECS